MVRFKVRVRGSKVLGLRQVLVLHWGFGKISVRVVIKVSVSVRETIRGNTTRNRNPQIEQLNTDGLLNVELTGTQ